jgi:hypothetical protein
MWSFYVKGPASWVTNRHLSSRPALSAIQPYVTQPYRKDTNNGRTVVDVTYNPPADGVTGTTIISEGTYVSACPAGVKPESEMLPDGTFAEKSGK